MTDPSAASERELKLQELIAAYLDAEADGQAPEAAVWLAAHPEFAEELRQFLADHQRMAEIGRPLRQAAAPLVPQGSAHPTVDSAKPDGQGESSLGTVRYFGEYELLEEIARGGMGVVYKARQVKLRRIVAVKMILAGQLAGEDDVQRFYTEARAAAKLHHPNIVAIHEVGQHDGQHYFSMDYVEGESLAERIARGPLPVREAAALMKTVALAVSFAHVESVVHRDLKPANILLDRQGEPHVTDFGLAKQITRPDRTAPGSLAESQTATGQVLGTPSYMPPEQAAGETEKIGTHSDIYSLGAVLYCALTGRPPFQAAGPVETLRQVLDSEPVSPRTLNPAVPRDLETICLKCLEKDPRRRYASAQELVDEIERFLGGKPIHARPTTWSERVLKWIRRRPAAAALVGVSMAAVVGLVALGMALAIQAHQLANEAGRREAAERQRGDLLDAQVASARSHLYSSDLAVAAAAFEKQDTQALREGLDALRPKPGEPDLRGFEWYYLWKQTNRELISLPTIKLADRHSDGPGDPDRLSERRRLVFSPDGKLLATRRNVCDAVTGRAIIEYDELAADQLFFSPDNKFICAGGSIIDLATRKGVKIPLAPRIAGTPPENGAIHLLPRGIPLGFLRSTNAFVVLHTGKKPTAYANVLGPTPMTHAETEVSVKSYDPVTGKETVHEVQFRQGYRLLAAALGEKRGLLALASTKRRPGFYVESDAKGGKDEVEVWDLIQGGHKLFQFDKSDEKFWDNDDLRDVLFSPDGDTLAVITRDNAIRLCDPATGKERLRLSPPSQFPGATPAHRYFAFSQDSKRFLALARPSHKLEIWDALTGKQLVDRDIGFAGPRFDVGERPEAALSPDGNTYATSGGARVVQLWETATGKLRATYLGHRHSIRDLTFSPDGAMLATLDNENMSPMGDANVKIWDAAGDKLIGLPLDTSAITAFDPSPDGKTVAVGFADGTIRLCEPHTLKEQRILHNNPDGVSVLQFSPDGRRLAASHARSYQEHNIDIWDVAGGQPIASFPGFLKGFDGKIVASIPSLDLWYFAAPGPDTISIWDVATKARLMEVKDTHNKQFAMTRDAQVAATVAYRREGFLRYKLWNVATGKELPSWPERLAFGDGRMPNLLKFSPNGKYLFLGDYLLKPPAGSKEFSVTGCLCDVATGKEVALFPVAWHVSGISAHAEANWTLAEFSPDSKWLLTVAHQNPLPSGDRSEVTLRDAATGKKQGTLGDPDRLAVLYAAFSPDSKTLVTLTSGKWVREPYDRDGKLITDGTDVRMEREDLNTGGTSEGSSPGRLSSMSISPVYEIHVWDVATRQRRNRFLVSWQAVEKLAFSADGQTVYTLISERNYSGGIPLIRRLQAWDPVTGQERSNVGDHGTGFHALAYTADGRLLALTNQWLNKRSPKDYSELYKLRIWDVLRRQELATAKIVTLTDVLDLDPTLLTVVPSTPPSENGFGLHRATMAISPDGKVKAMTGAHVTLRDAATGEVRHTLKGYGQRVWRLAFSPDSKTLAVGDFSGKIQLWNVASGRLLLTLPGHAGSVNGLAFRADGRVLASCSDTEIRLWQAASDEDVAVEKP